MVTRAGSGWLGVVAAVLIGCPGSSDVASDEGLAHRDAGVDSGQSSRAGAGADQASTARAWPNDPDFDDAGTAACELPTEQTRAAARAYCGGCGESTDPTCCIVRGLCCVDAFRELAPLTFAACEDGASACDQPAVAFGPAGAEYRAGSWVPAPSDSVRSGLALTGSVDARDRIRIGARLQRSDPDACVGCAELVGIGLSVERESAQTVETRTRTPELSIVVSSELSQIVVATGSKTLWSMAIDALPHDILLERDPDGRSRLSIDGTLRTALVAVLPEGPLQPSIFGRSDPRLDRSKSARIGSAFAASTRCESTAGWDRPAEEQLPADRASTGSGGRRAPSLIELEGSHWLAYESQGVIVAETLGASSAQLVITGEPGSFRERVADPEWAREGDRLGLYYTALGPDGRRSLGRARFEGGLPSDRVEHAQLLAPQQLGAQEVFGPSVAQDPDGTLLLLATAVDAGGVARLVLLRNAGEAADPRYDVESARALLTVDRHAVRPDFEALGSADLIYRRGQYQVYFAASSASRWLIYLLTSADLRHWLPTDAVIGGREGTGLDDLGVQDPETRVDGDTFNLYYTALSPANETRDQPPTTRLARVTREGRAICGGTRCPAQADCAPTTRAAVSCGP